MLVQPLVAKAHQVAQTHQPLAPPQTPFVVVIAGFSLVPLVPATQTELYGATPPFQPTTSIFKDHWFCTAPAVVPLPAFPFLCIFPLPDIVSCTKTLYPFGFNI